jgi:CubicO group peptidase (beta-lactamase class C family)
MISRKDAKAQRKNVRTRLTLFLPIPSLRHCAFARDLLLLFPLLATSFVSAAPVETKDIDVIVQDALKAWQTPGVAVAVVKDGEVVYLKGHGVRKLGKKVPVTPDTLFPIASCTKGFTVAAMGLLIDEHKMDWDDRVRKHVPSFHLSDPLADGDVRLRDLVCHRTGLRGHDFLWYRAPWDQEEAIRKIGLVKLDKPFRTALQYQSIMFMVAGRAVESASKSKWSDFVKSRLLDPLEMTGTCFTTAETEKAKDIASPHGRDEKGEVVVVSRYAEEIPNAASSIHSTARDLAQWVKFQLSDGTWKGKRLLSAKNLEEMHTPQIALRMEGSVKAANPATHLMSYGMAWLIQDYKGHKVISHAGAIDGFRTQLVLVPDAKLGIVLLNNLQDTRMNLALGNSLIDQLLGLPKQDWNAYLLEQVKKEQSAAIERQKEREKKRQPDAKPSRDLTAFAGEYKEPAYGVCRVVLEDGKLVWRWSTFTCPLEHFENDTFLGKHPTLGAVYFTFHFGSDGTMLKVEEPLDVKFKKTE